MALETRKYRIILVLVFSAIYEILLIGFASGNFSLNRYWYTVVYNMPVFQSNIEFVIFLGQFPVVFLLFWLKASKDEDEEKDLLRKYGNTLEKEKLNRKNS